MFARLRQSLLLYVLILVAAGTWLTQERTRSWEQTLWIEIHPLAGSDSTEVRDYVAQLTSKQFKGMEEYLNAQADAYGVALATPVRIDLGPTLDSLPPPLPTEAGAFKAIIWSLKMRWWATTTTWDLAGPEPDIRKFAIFHAASDTPMLDRSGALQKGMVAVANLFAERRMHGSNLVIATHELLLTLGATDKYDRTNNLPIFPEGFANPDKEPTYPQKRAEIMAGRIPLSESAAIIPDNLRLTKVGSTTAVEIGWQQ